MIFRLCVLLGKLENLNNTKFVPWKFELLFFAKLRSADDDEFRSPTHRECSEESEEEKHCFFFVVVFVRWIISRLFLVEVGEIEERK